MKLTASAITVFLAQRSTAYRLKDLTTATPSMAQADDSLDKAKISVEIFKLTEEEMDDKNNFDQITTIAPVVMSTLSSDTTKEVQEEKEIPWQDSIATDPIEGPWLVMLGVESHGLDTIGTHKEFLCRQSQDLLQMANNHPEVDSQLNGHWTNNEEFIWDHHQIGDFSFHTREDGEIFQSYFQVKCRGKKSDCLRIGENGEFGKFIDHECDTRFRYRSRASEIEPVKSAEPAKNIFGRFMEKMRDQAQRVDQDDDDWTDLIDLEKNDDEYDYEEYYE